MKYLLPLLALLLGASGVFAAGTCPPGYGMNWQGQCLDCSKTSNALVCGDAGGGSAASAPQSDIDMQRTEQVINAVTAIGEMLDNQEAANRAAEEQAEQQRQAALEAQRQAEAAQRAASNSQVQDLESSMAAMEGSDWRSRAEGGKDNPAKRALDCNCRRVVDSCTASIQLVAKQKTGVDYRVTSSEPSCSKVSYYIDNTPYITVLNNRNAALEHSAGLGSITAKSFEVERCDVCARE